jgi:cation diffusion facilitator CzcD-associated flavoprotein CzcO
MADNGTTVEVVVVGSGFSGLDMGVKLKKAGIQDFVILEKAGDVGGIWRDNTYPGCECDVQSHLYSLSYEQNPNWTKSFSTQPEIWTYLRHVADKYGLREHIRFGAKVTAMAWDDDAQQWLVSTESGDQYVSRFVATSVGALQVPSVPRLKGIRQFTGKAWHSAQWDHDHDLTGKRVAVVGTGASAVQFVPKVAEQARSVTLFQRTAPWVLPKSDPRLPSWVRAMFRRVPISLRAYRAFLYWTRELAGIALNGHPALLAVGERASRRYLAAQIADPVLRAKLTPHYRLGCKRLLLTSDYYPALTRDNVDVVTDPIAEVRANGIVDGSGIEHPVDVIVYGTGFTTTLTKMKIVGRQGRSLWKEWTARGAVTHRGITVAGFPNMFFLLGPNTGLGHNSVVFMIEAQTRFAVRAIELVTKRGAGAIDTRADAQQRFQDTIQRKLVDAVWTRGGCTSWYLDDKGVNRSIWPGGSWRYWLATSRIDEREFELLAKRPASRPAEQATLTAGS